MSSWVTLPAGATDIYRLPGQATWPGGRLEIVKTPGASWRVAVVDEQGQVMALVDPAGEVDKPMTVWALNEKIPLPPTATLESTEDVTKYNEIVEALKGQREIIQQNYEKFMTMDQATFNARRRELGFGSFYDKERMLGFIQDGDLWEIGEKDYILQGVLLGIQLVKAVDYDKEVFVAYFGVEDQGGGRGMLPVLLGEMGADLGAKEFSFNGGHRNYLGGRPEDITVKPINEWVELLMKRIGDVVYFDVVTFDCNDECWEKEKKEWPPLVDLEQEHKLYVDLLKGGVRGKVLLGEIVEIVKKPGGAEGLKRFKILGEETNFEELVKIQYYQTYTADERTMNFFSNK